MRISPLLAAAVVAWALSPCLGSAGARSAPDGPDEAGAAGYRADSLLPVAPGVPDEVQVLPAPGEEPWPRRVAAELEERVLREWPGERMYGPLYSSVGLWLRYPMVTASVGGRVLVPAVADGILTIAGRVEAPEVTGARRVMVVVDASASANALTPVHVGSRVEYLPVLEAERRALARLLDLTTGDWLEVGVMAFGEGTWTVAELGSPASELRRGLEQFRQAQPRGEGRTDVVCALWSAAERLERAGGHAQREIVLLTDGDMPHSGRFADCAGPYMRRSPAAREACEARRNRSPCPAAHRLDLEAGASDLVQLGIFARHAEGRVRITPLVFEPDRSARPYEQLARRTGSRMVRVPSPEIVEAALPALVSSRIRAVTARNLTTGNHTGDLSAGRGAAFEGSLPLREGANDVELRVHGDRGIAGLFRFRVYSTPGYPDRYLARLRERNEELERRSAQLRDRRASARRPELHRRVEIEVPAAPD